MKKIFLSILLAAFTLSIYSCRETTEDRTETTIEEADADRNDAMDANSTIDVEETGTDLQQGNQETDSL